MSSRHDLRRIAEELLILADESESGPRDVLACTPPGHVDPDYLIRMAHAVLAARRLRARHFSEQLFREPAWDMLLDLFIQEAKGRRSSIKSVCVAACVPPTTALRWVVWLENAGLIVRNNDQRDGRRVFVSLSPAGHEAMRDYLRELTKRLRVIGGSPLLLAEAQI